MKLAKRIERAFANETTTAARLTNNFFACLTIISIVSLVIETVSSLSDYAHVFLFIEWFVVAFFTLEYAARFYVSRPRSKYPLSFFGIIDLLAILPTLLGLGNLTFLKSARALRIIRLLRMMRIAKVVRGSRTQGEDMSMFSLNVTIYFATLLFALLATGTAMYIVEPSTSAFASIPAGMWWSLKVFLAGVPVVEPVTALGEMFFVLTRFVGLLLLGLLIGVTGNVFRALLTGARPE